MLRFDPLDPFPLVNGEDYSYAETQAHAAKVDEWLGLDTAGVELCIQVRTRSSSDFDGRQESWVGLPIKSMLTPYTELRHMLTQVQPQAGQLIVDLGAAYGRMGFVMSRHAPGVRFLGFELLEERVREGARCLAKYSAGRDIQLLAADLKSSQFVLPRADIYFIYDYGSREAVEKTLRDLQSLAIAGAFIVIGRGGRVRDAIERHQPWLSQVTEPVHFPHYSIYRSARESAGG